MKNIFECYKLDTNGLGLRKTSPLVTVISKKNEGARRKWPVGKIVQVYPSEDGLVRNIKLLMADGNLDEHGKRQGPPSYLNRPIHKLVLLLTK